MTEHDVSQALLPSVMPIIAGTVASLTTASTRRSDQLPRITLMRRLPEPSAHLGTLPFPSRNAADQMGRRAVAIATPALRESRRVAYLATSVPHAVVKDSRSGYQLIRETP